MACSVCHDEGEIVIGGMSVNPFSGVPVYDPQLEDVVPCPRCSRTPIRSDGSVEQLVNRIENTRNAA